ncbi:MAG: RluA family pseudouridine synthase [Syntrophomonadaceae bacterium]|mgnify:CR=1 FL=1|nr:RluA family pseudouridine synthase [Syntrophomonadaceae bacterium]
MKIITLRVDEENQGDRIDQYVSDQISFLSRTLVVQFIKNGDIKVEGKSVKASHRLRSGEEVVVIIPDPVQVMIEPQDIPLQIIYEDQDLVVIDKPQGMVVHPAAGNWDGTLVNALMFHIQDLSGINGEIRPGIVHRLDKDTSGLLVVAKNDNSHRSLAEQIKNHTVTREYMALVHGHINENQGKVEAPVGRNPRDRKKMAVVSGGRAAITWYRVVQRMEGYTLVRCRLETGRTHQIRVHMAFIGHPVVGDPLYGPRKNAWNLDKQVLHAVHLAFEHPTTGQVLEFESPLPSYFDELGVRREA